MHLYGANLHKGIPTGVMFTKSSMLVLDFSQLTHAVTYQFEDDIRKADADLDHIYRNAILSSILYRKKVHAEYADEIVIACDGKENYWRKDIFEHYKANRKKLREDQQLPWDDIHATQHKLRLEFTENLPFKMIYHPKAEADDVMAVMVEHIAMKRPVAMGVEEIFRDVLLVASDKDITQLLKYPNVRQFSPQANKYLTLSCSPKEYLRRLILTGDSGDGIPNVFSREDSLVAKIRQTPCTEKKMAPFLIAENFIGAAPDEQIRQRVEMNTRLISLAFIPPKIRDNIIEQYDAPIEGTRMKTLRYLAKNKCKMLLDRTEEF